MDCNCKQITLNEQIDNLFAKLLINNSEDSIEELISIFSQIILNNNFNYDKKKLYELLILLEELRFNSPILNILINYLKYQTLSLKIFEKYDKNNSNEKLSPPITAENNNRNDKSTFQMIEINPEQGTKTVITYEKDPLTGQEKEVNRYIMSEPTEMNLDAIFSGILQSQIESDN